MNIFILDKDIQTSVQSYIDKHIVKIPLEVAQLLCTARRHSGDERPKYKSTHVNHPWSLFTRLNRENYLYVCCYGMELCTEYEHRYGKIHACRKVIIDCVMSSPFFYNLQADIPKIYSLSRIGYFDNRLPCCVPNEYKGDNVVQSYRDYYIEDKVFNKSGKLMASWKNRNKPSWFVDKYNVL